MTQDTLSDHDLADQSELMSHGWVPLYAAPVPAQPATLPLEIAGSLLPDDYVSPRLAAEAYRENEPDDQTCGACGGIHDTLTPCDQLAAQQPAGGAE